MDKKEALIALNIVSDIGSVRLAKLLDYFGSPEKIFIASADKLVSLGVHEKTASRITAFDCKELSKEIQSIRKLKINIVTIADDDYPVNLKNISGAPIVLYVKGNLKNEDILSVAVVGSRRASFYGLSCAEKFSYGLAREGVAVISGMARGVDTYAHQGALNAGGRTVAVMGSGFGHIYPPENKRLVDRISENGAVISEFPVDTLPLPCNFPRRNRIISGLSLGVLVVEAAKNSGAIITADFALEQGRDVFALPGKIDTQNSFGTNELIKQGAKLVSSVEDIIEEFVLPIAGRQQFKQPREAVTDLGLAPVEGLLYNLISHEPILLDEIMDKTNLEFGQLSQLLLGLQIKKLVKQLPGKQFIRN